jgi:hypothetical protein
MAEVADHLSPHQLVELVGAGGRLRAAQLLGSHVHGQHRLAAVVALLGAVGLHLAARGAGLAALAAAHEVAQQVALGADVARAEAGVALVERLRAAPGVEVDDGRHRHSDPLLPGPLGADGPMAGGVAGQAGRLWELDPPVVVQRPGVGRLAQQAVKRRGRPALVAPGRGDLRLDEADGDRAHRQALADVPLEDLAHDRRLLLADHQAGR